MNTSARINLLSEKYGIPVNILNKMLNSTYPLTIDQLEELLTKNLK